MTASGEAGRTPRQIPFPPPPPRVVQPRAGSGAVALGIVTALSVVASFGAAPHGVLSTGGIDPWIAGSGHHEVVHDAESATIFETDRSQGLAAAVDATPALFAAFNADDGRTSDWVLETTQRDGVEQAWLGSLRGDGLVTVATVQGATAVRYEPAALSWPTRAEAGVTWVAEGMMAADGDQFPYRRTGRLEASSLGPGCLRSVVEEIRGERQRSWSETRCRGRGVVARDDQRAEAAPPIASGIPAPASGPTAGPWPSNWRAETDPVVNGGGPVTIQLPAAPVAVDAGFAALNEASGNLLLVLPDDGRWRVLWRRSPGATPTALGASGELLVVATADRRLVAYDVVGRWLWTTPLDDVVNVPPVEAWPGVIVVATLGGELGAYERTTGRRLWGVAAPAGSGVPPLAAGAHVVAAGGRDLRAVDAGGRPVWKAQAPAQVRTLAYAGSKVVVSTVEGHLLALDAEGRPAWGVRRGQACRELHVLERWLVCVDDMGAAAYDPTTGALVWQRAAGSRGSGTDGRDVVLAGGPAVVRLTGDGGERGRWPERARRGYDVWVVTLRDGALVTDEGADLTVWRRP
ncbi:outer membrane protein assembly factor BamB family protein [Mariniluteicoccus flavus]